MKTPVFCCFSTLFEIKAPLCCLLRSLVEDDDAHMKVALGYGDMGISAHLQASKTGNTRFFTSNTHSSVVLQVRVRKRRERRVQTHPITFPFFPERFHTVQRNACSMSQGLLHAVCQWFTFPTTYMRLSPCFFRPPSITVGEMCYLVDFLAVYTPSTPWKRSFMIVLTQLCLVLASKLICFSKWLTKQIEKEPLFLTFLLEYIAV